MPEVSVIKNNYINVEPIGIKKANPFTCIGWIKNIAVNDTYPLILLAVSDSEGIVVGGNSIRIEVIRYVDKYYRLQFSNSISKPIYKYTGVAIDDGEWHFLSYICLGEGIIKYYVDSIEVPGEDTIGDVGLPKYIAWSREHRLGSGDVWVPYLYRNGQYIEMYNWRYGNNFIMDTTWLSELMNREKLYIQGNS
jgi:hypothetical protein